MIYLDSAATSYYRPREVAEAVAAAVRGMGNPNRSAAGPALLAARAVYETRELVDRMFHGYGPEQTAFTMNATEALNAAVKGFLKPGDVAVTTVLEHNSLLRPLYEMEKRGVRLKIIGCDSRGVLDYGRMEEEIRAGAALVACTHVSNLTGNLVDIRRIGAWCRKYHARFLVDAAQSAGIFPIDMRACGIDILCFTGHKGLLGPQGTGGLCLSREVRLQPLKSGGSGFKTFSKTQPGEMPAVLEAGTQNAHGIAGLRAGLLWLNKYGIEQVRRKEQALAWEFYTRVEGIPGVRVYGDFSTMERGPVVALNIGEEDSALVFDYLAQKYEIYTRSGGHCAPLMHRALGTEEQGCVRFSFSSFNTMDEIEQAAEAVRGYLG